jgi:hypothetical protein
MSEAPYGEERRNRVGNGPTCGEIAEQGVPFGGAIPAPVVEPRIEAGVVSHGYHECQ